MWPRLDPTYGVFQLYIFVLALTWLEIELLSESLTFILPDWQKFDVI